MSTILDKVKELVTLGDQYTRQGRIQDAKKYYNKALEIIETIIISSPTLLKREYEKIREVILDRINNFIGDEPAITIPQPSIPEISFSGSIILSYESEKLALTVYKIINSAKQELFLTGYSFSDFHIYENFLFTDFIKSLADKGIIITIVTVKNSDHYYKLQNYPNIRIFLCKRMHMKTIIADEKWSLLSTGNLSARGLGFASTGLRNFEVSVVLDETNTKTLVNFIKNVITGFYCKSCYYYRNRLCNGIKRLP